ncbi:MAG: hypothetical protein D6719_04520 [Candidatus Dadabacteria bacterium]|nr:MAG: hypothetical protein D6719_04520 [Candidatus Dadabacteria bacterium]
MNKSLNKPVIGVLSGIGPKVTGPFVDSIINYSQKLYGAVYDHDYPPILISSQPVCFYADRECDQEVIVHDLLEGLKRLEDGGATFAVIACNTVHKYFDFLKEQLNIPLFSILDATLDELAPEDKQVVLLATEATVKSNLYQDKLTQKGVEVVWLPEWQKVVTDCIVGLRDPGEHQQIVSMWEDLQDAIVARGIETALIGCTDFSVVAGLGKVKLKLIDSMKALAKMCVRRYWEILERSKQNSFAVNY